MISIDTHRKYMHNNITTIIDVINVNIVVEILKSLILLQLKDSRVVIAQKWNLTVIRM